MLHPCPFSEQKEVQKSSNVASVAERHREEHMDGRDSSFDLDIMDAAREE